MSAPCIEIVDTTPLHLRLMSTAMSADTAHTALRLGISTNKALWRSFKQSIYRKTAFIDGKIAAIWGLGAICFSDVAFPWLVMSDEVQEYPMRVAFAYRKELEKMQGMFPELQDYVDEKNEKAIRLLKLMGFKIGDELFKHGDINFCLAVRRA